MNSTRGQIHVRVHIENMLTSGINNCGKGERYEWNSGVKPCPLLTHRYSCCEIGQLNSMLAKGKGGSRGWWSSPTYLENPGNH